MSHKLLYNLKLPPPGPASHQRPRASARARTHSLGPGSGAWAKPTARAATHAGLDPALLARAGAVYGQRFSNNCIAVVRDGQLVLRESFGFGAGNRPVESMSAAKTVTAALMGVAHRMGLFAMDTPLLR